MSVIAYGRPDQKGLSAMRRGLSQLGIEWKWSGVHVSSPFDPEPCDFAVLEGERSRNSFVLESLRNAGIPALIVEYGYLRRESGYLLSQIGGETGAQAMWQVSLNALGWCPSQDCPPDRYQALGVTMGDLKSGSAIVIYGDHPGSPQMGVDYRWPRIRRWAERIASQLKNVTDRQIYWKPHPAVNQGLPGIDLMPDGFDDIHLAICHNSNVGNELLHDGISVMSNGQTALSRVCPLDLDSCEAPTVPDRERYFNRLAYGQWTLTEISRGIPVATYLELGELECQN